MEKLTGCNLVQMVGAPAAAEANLIGLTSDDLTSSLDIK
jgi:hypothetical protein